MRFLELLANGRQRLSYAITASAGAVAASINKIVATNAQGVLDPSLLNAATSGNNKILMTGANGRLLASVMPTGIGEDANQFLVAEPLTAGDGINTFTDTGNVAKVRKADANAGREQNGFVLQSYAQGDSATVFAEGTNTQASGLTPGADVFLSATAGKSTTTPPAEPAMLQWIGYAVSATSYNFQRGIAVERPAA